jgi:hypothetical protein
MAMSMAASQARRRLRTMASCRVKLVSSSSSWPRYSSAMRLRQRSRVALLARRTSSIDQTPLEDVLDEVGALLVEPGVSLEGQVQEPFGFASPKVEGLAKGGHLGLEG